MIQETIDLLGKKATDKVTGYAGVITSVSFDLYGCVQAVVNAGLDKDGKPQPGQWLDVNRLEISGEPAVMSRPDFEAMARTPAEYSVGAAEKPAK